jgi:aldehyde dehydrogenase (NAD+)
MTVDAPTGPRESLEQGAGREWRMYIGGERVDAADGRWTDVMSPSRSGTVLGRLPRADAADVDRAVEAAGAALPGWLTLPVVEHRPLV